MTLKFSLRRLLAGVTAVCVMAAIATRYPLPALLTGLTLAAFAPALAIALILRAFAFRKSLTFSLSLVGAAVGGILSPTVLGDMSLIDACLIQLQYAAPLIAGGALLLGGIALIGDYLQRPQRSRGW